MEEIWKDIEDYEGLYEVSNIGRVRSLDRIVTYCDGRTTLHKGVILKHVITRGYYYVHLNKNGVMKNYRISRLVAIAFIPNIDNLPEVNHKDENTFNDEYSNLEWCTRQYNCNYGNHNSNLSKSLTGKFIGDNHPMYGKKQSEKSKDIMRNKALERYKIKSNHARAKKIICTTTNKVFGCIEDASRYYNVNRTGISECCRGVRKVSHNLSWMYYDEWLEQKQEAC
jgi:hypothetical protein